MSATVPVKIHSLDKWKQIDTAFTAMRETLRWFAENAVNMTRHPELYTAIDHHVKEAYAALKLADEIRK